ncbi:MAG: hypothetical protein CM1200mP40_16830 [Gammaproteobacteria bacterium]|nr:MAG: hypothetical protein CM1200mP40_16830 [Gammaproteobacteria bacterium]
MQNLLIWFISHYGKYFNSGIGAILAGSKNDLEYMFHTRRMFGGNLYAGWSASLVARHFMESYIDRLKNCCCYLRGFLLSNRPAPRLHCDENSKWHELN